MENHLQKNHTYNLFGFYLKVTVNIINISLKTDSAFWSKTFPCVLLTRICKAHKYQEIKLKRFIKSFWDFFLHIKVLKNHITWNRGIRFSIRVLFFKSTQITLRKLRNLKENINRILKLFHNSSFQRRHVTFLSRNKVSWSYAVIRREFEKLSNCDYKFSRRNLSTFWKYAS